MLIAITSRPADEGLAMPMYISLCTYTRIPILLCTHTCIHTNTCTFTYIYYAYIHSCLFPYVYYTAYTHTYTCADTCTCTYAHTHTHTHTHTCTYICLLELVSRSMLIIVMWFCLPCTSLKKCFRTIFGWIVSWLLTRMEQTNQQATYRKHVLSQSLLP